MRTFGYFVIPALSLVNMGAQALIIGGHPSGTLSSLQARQYLNRQIHSPDFEKSSAGSDSDHQGSHQNHVPQMSGFVKRNVQVNNGAAKIATTTGTGDVRHLESVNKNAASFHETSLSRRENGDGSSDLSHIFGDVGPTANSNTQMAKNDASNTASLLTSTRFLVRRQTTDLVQTTTDDADEEVAEGAPGTESGALSANEVSFESSSLDRNVSVGDNNAPQAAGETGSLNGVEEMEGEQVKEAANNSEASASQALEEANTADSSMAPEFEERI
ncbi:hypothetical protein D9613_000494 [Agrocybe pediades]|uniref:Uncharacterized protein n=1 Tax=Agrocybe pediades TaxID=84607 RepID=A0A8H4R0W3_9AGAR|nr:hypothetical protein D9613_000494 [Agrocybe pediades]